MIEIAIVSGGDLLLESRRIIKSEFRMNTEQLFNNQTITLKRTVLMSMMAISLGALACLPRHKLQLSPISRKLSSCVRRLKLYVL